MDNFDLRAFHKIDKFLDKEIFLRLEEFYTRGYEMYKGDGFNIDKEKVAYSYYDSFKNKYIDIFFANEISKAMEDMVYEMKYSIESEIKKFFASKQELQEYIRFIKSKLDILFDKKAFKEITFLRPYFKEIEQLIKKYSISYSITTHFIPSFNLIAETPEKQEEKINLLFTLLTELPSLISCTKEDFINAFSGKEVKEGIHWLVRGKNKLISKASLLYFIGKLIDKPLCILAYIDFNMIDIPVKNKFIDILYCS